MVDIFLKELPTTRLGRLIRKEKRRILAPIPVSGVQFWVSINFSSHSAKDFDTG